MLQGSLPLVVEAQHLEKHCHGLLAPVTGAAEEWPVKALDAESLELDCEAMMVGVKVRAFADPRCCAVAWVSKVTYEKLEWSFAAKVRA